MALYMVTVKLEKNPDHDPRNKVTGPCPINPVTCCTDITGEHHTLLVEAPHEDDARIVAIRHGYYHVTRVESLGLPLS